MRVLHLGAGNMFGGIESMMLTLARERSGCPEMIPEFGFCFEGRISEELRKTGVKVHHFGAVRFSRPWSIWFARRRLRRLLTEQRPDAVITHACWPHSLFGSTIVDLKIPVVFWAHDAAHPTHWLDRKAARIHPNRVISNSHYTLQSLKRAFPQTPAEVIYPPVQAVGVDQARRAQLRNELTIEADTIVILMASRLEEWKGHTLLLESLGKLKTHPNWVCWIAGGAQRPQEVDYQSRLQEIAQRKGIQDRIRWLGERRDVADLLAAADLYCQPNLSPEPFGIAYVEALYAAKPVISTRQGGAAEIIDETCGLLVEPNNVEALAAALKMLIDDPDLRVRLGIRGPERASSLCDSSLQINKLFRQLLVANRRP